MAVVKEGSFNHKNASESWHFSKEKNSAPVNRELLLEPDVITRLGQPLIRSSHQRA